MAAEVAAVNRRGGFVPVAVKGLCPRGVFLLVDNRLPSA